MTNTVPPMAPITAVKKNTCRHSPIVDCSDVSAPTTIGPRMAPMKAIVDVNPMIAPACRGARSSWLVATVVEVKHDPKTATVMLSTTKRRLQPTTYPDRSKKLLDNDNPMTQTAFRTKFVDSLPGARSQSTKIPANGSSKNDAAYGIVHSVPFVVMLTPRISCRNIGSTVAKLK